MQSLCLRLKVCQPGFDSLSMASKDVQIGEDGRLDYSLALPGGGNVMVRAELKKKAPAPTMALTSPAPTMALTDVAPTPRRLAPTQRKPRPLTKEKRLHVRISEMTGIEEQNVKMIMKDLARVCQEQVHENGRMRLPKICTLSKRITLRNSFRTRTFEGHKIRYETVSNKIVVKAKVSTCIKGKV